MDLQPKRTWTSRRRAGAAALAVALSLSLAAAGGAARASIMMALDLPELVKRADHIAVVDVMTVQSEWDARHERIISKIDLKVVESWKGAGLGTATPADHLRVVQLGGTVDDITMTVTGLGTFTPGERTLVFLRGTMTGAQLVGMTQGKRPLHMDAATNAWKVAPARMARATLLRPAGTPAATPPASDLMRADSTREASLDEMRAAVKGLVGAAKP